MRNNIQGFFNILEIAKQNKIKRIIYASSSSVYGDSNIFPLTEKQILKQKICTHYLKILMKNCPRFILILII